MVRWLSFLISPSSIEVSQEGLLLQQAYRRIIDTVSREVQADYVYGWEVLREDGYTLMHPGQNPNASAFVIFSPSLETGVGMMGNSNNNALFYAAIDVFEHLRDQPEQSFTLALEHDPLDLWLSLISIVLGGASLGLVWVTLYRRQSSMGEVESLRQQIFQQSWAASELPGNWLQWLKQAFVCNLILIIMLWAAPPLFTGLSWQTLWVWAGWTLPLSGAILVLFMNLALACFSYIAHSNHKYSGQLQAKAIIGKVIVLTVLAGLLNTALVLSITHAIDLEADSIFYSALFMLSCIYLYLSTRRAAELQTMRFGYAYVTHWRLKLIKRVLGSDYQRVDAIRPGKIQSILGENTQELSNSILVVVPVMANVLTVIFLLGYMLFAKSTMVSIALIGSIIPIVFIYYSISEKANRLVPKALQARSEFMDTVEDLHKGYKSLQRRRVKQMFFEHVSKVAERFKSLRQDYEKRYINAFITGDMLLMLLLVAVVLLFPVLLSDFEKGLSAEYLIILLYLVGPLNMIMDAMPEIMKLRGLLGNVVDFTQGIAPQQHATSTKPLQPIHELKLENISFNYKGEGQTDSVQFGIGPINLLCKPGKSYFFTGGNGSGKSTLAMIMSGLMSADDGRVMLNSQSVSAKQLVEYVGSIFSENWIFKRIYDRQLMQSIDKIQENLIRLKMAHKVQLDEQGVFDTIQLSTGQRKRIALAMLLADTSPIVVLDEWAADQDPVAKKRFYNEWIPELKAQGKIVLVVTHDDEYFCQADTLVKMNEGQITELKERENELYCH